jgi:TonB family protein
MFSYLVESDLHKGELKRKGTFFLATMIAYAVVLLAMGVVGVYAFEAHIDDQNLELVALVPPDIEEARPREVAPRPRTNTPPTQPSAGGRPITGGLIKNIPTNVSNDLTRISGAAKGETVQTPPIFSTGGTKLNQDDYVSLLRGGGNNANNQSSARGNGGDSLVNEEPPQIKKKEEPPQKQRILYVGPVTGRALSLPQPVYTPIARAAGAQGPVTVEIVIDEAGRVISAHATGGHPLLKAESEKAAYRARFSPTLLQDQPVKVKGVITFNFILR